MAKPICLVSVTTHIEMHLEEVQKELEKKFDDYHVLVFPAPFNQEKILEIEVIYDKDFTLAQFDEIKSTVQEKLKELENEYKAKAKTESIY